MEPERGENIKPAPVAVVIEYHSSGAAVEGNHVCVTHASLYIVTGVAADQVFGLRDMQCPDAAYVQVAWRLGKGEVEALADALADAMRTRAGIEVDVTSMYDE